MLFAILFAMLAQGASPTDPIYIEEDRISIVIRREFYGVSGLSFRDVSFAVYSRQLDWGSSASSTIVSLSHDAVHNETAVGCTLSDFSVSLDLTLTFPVWVEYLRRSSRNQRRWDEFFETMQVHEHVHADIAMESARRARERFHNVSSFPDCDQLDAELEQILVEARDWQRRNQFEYDRVTDGGRSQEAADRWTVSEDADGQ